MENSEIEKMEQELLEIYIHRDKLFYEAIKLIRRIADEKRRTWKKEELKQYIMDPGV